MEVRLGKSSPKEKISQRRVKYASDGGCGSASRKGEGERKQASKQTGRRKISLKNEISHH